MNKVKMITCGSGISGRRLKDDLNLPSFSGRPKFIINWGCDTNYKVPMLPSEKWFNKRKCVDIAKNKLLTFNELKGSNVPVPFYTTNKQVMEEVRYHFFKGKNVYCRHELESSQGRGITICDEETSLPDAPLYVAEAKGDREYRVHVFNGEVIQIQRKYPKPEEEVDELIRSHDRGWCLSVCDLDRVHEGIKALGLRTSEVMDLQFCAVDLRWCPETETGEVLEVNTAPGLEEDGSTYDAYLNAFRDFFNLEEPRATPWYSNLL